MNEDVRATEDEPGGTGLRSSQTPGVEPVQPPPTPPDEPKMVAGKGRSKRLLRAGIFSIVGMIILLVGVFVVGQKQNLFSNTVSIRTGFKSAEGLKSGAAVMFSGINIGTVSSVDILLDSTSVQNKGASVRVIMSLDGQYHKFLRTSTVATISQQGLIGDKIIELSLTNVNAPMVRDGDSIASVPPPNYFAILDQAQAAVKNTTNITASLDTLLYRFRRGEGTLGKLLTDESAYNGLVAVSTSAQQLINSTNQQIGGMSTTLNHAASNMDQLTAQARDLIGDIGRGKGTFGALLYDRSLYDSLEALTGTLNQTASSAGFAAREFGLDMRGLRSSWLLGGLFGAGQDEQNNELQKKMILIKQEEMKRQQELLDQREKEIMQKEQKVGSLH